MIIVLCCLIYRQHMPLIRSDPAHSVLSSLVTCEFPGFPGCIKDTHKDITSMDYKVYTRVICKMDFGQCKKCIAVQGRVHAQPYTVLEYKQQTCVSLLRLGSAQQALQTPQTMLDEVVWCVSDPPQQARLDPLHPALPLADVPSHRCVCTDADSHHGSVVMLVRALASF